MTGNSAANSPLVIIATTNPMVSVPPIINFETVGHNWHWDIADNGDNSQLLYSVVSNPSVSGLNTTDSCAKFVVNTSATAWAKLWTLYIEPFVVSNDNCMVKILVNKDVISPFILNFENGLGSISFERSDSNSVINQWDKTFTGNAYETSIDLSDLSIGNYLMTVELENGDCLTRKVLK